MTTAPGSYVTTAARQAGASTATPPAASAFLAGVSLWGPTGTVTLCKSLSEYLEAQYPGLGALDGDLELILALFAAGGFPVSQIEGGITAVASLFDEGLERLYVRRVVGPAAATATLVLVDDDDDPAFTVSGRYVGELANLVTVAVDDGTDSGIKVTVGADDDALGGDIVLDNLASNAAAVAAINSHPLLSAVVVAVAGEGGIAVTAAADNLAGGATDFGSITSAGILEAATFPVELGPGVLVDASGALVDALISGDAPTAADTVEGWGAMLNSTRRILLLHKQLAAGTEAQLVTELEELAGKRSGLLVELTARHGEAAANELVSGIGYVVGYVPRRGVITGVDIVVPAVTLAVGARARAIANVGPHQAPAGVNGLSVANAAPLVSATSDSTGIAGSDTVLTLIHAAGGNAVRRIAGTTRLYGWRSIAGDASDWVMLTARDVVNAIAGEADTRTEELPFAFVDGKGHAFARLEGILTGIAQEYATAGALYPGLDDAGIEVDPGYTVDTGPSVNTPATIAAGQIIGVLGVRPTPTASVVLITVRRASVGGPI